VSCFCEKAAAVDSPQSPSSGPGQQLDGVSQSADGSKIQRKRNAGFSATASQDLEDIEEINHANYYDKIKNAGTPVVLIDFYTSWCGPCKLIYPTLLEMKDELSGKVCSCVLEGNWLDGREEFCWWLTHPN
jgi:thiol-disulfide isomerase/thioredoxin